MLNAETRGRRAARSGRGVMSTMMLAALTGVAGLAAIPTAALGQIEIRSQLVVSGLSQPVAAIAPPGDTGRLFVVEQTGRVRILNLSNNTLGATFINVGPTSGGGLNLTTASGERGLLGLTFHPSFNTNGFFFLSYTDISTGASVLRRYTAVAPTPGNFAGATAVDTGSGREILRIARTASNHNGGTVAFGPDGFLYWGMGDSGGGGDPSDAAQNINELRGKMLRLDINSDAFPADPNLNYAIPFGNPFAGSVPGRDEIWTYGLRNPWKWSFDALTGDLWIADVGQNAFEEVNLEPAGAGAGRNYGWDCREGFAAFGSCTGTFTPPLIDFTHSGTGTCSITGGFVYRGSAIPTLYGKYIVADYCADWIYALTPQSSGLPTVTELTGKLSTLNGPIGDIVSFAQDGTGEMYVISVFGSLYKIVPDDGNCGCPCILDGPQGVILEDNFETNKGWVTGGTATSGQWTRAIPVNSNSDANDPVGDSDGSGRAYVTGNTVNVDVDGGTTVLISPALDFTKGEISLCYDYFLNLNNAQATDGLFVEVSSNGTGGPWIAVKSHTADQGLRWIRATITSSELATAGVTNTSNMRVRFTAQDLGTDSTVEVGLDAIGFRTGNPFPDCNDNGIDDAQDISGGTSADCNANSIPDECDIASGALDADGGPVGNRAGGASFFNLSCAGCHAPDGTGDTGPNIRNKDRTTITQRLTLQIPHPGGGFPNLTQQNAADLEAFLADGGSKGRPDGIPDSCQTLIDCDNDGVTDGRELALGTQIDIDYDGIPDDCDCRGDFNNDGFVDDSDFVIFAAAYEAFTVPPADAVADLNRDDFVDDADFVIFAATYEAFVCP